MRQQNYDSQFVQEDDRFAEDNKILAALAERVAVATIADMEGGLRR